jgi:hypothetical protein
MPRGLEQIATALAAPGKRLDMRCAMRRFLTPSVGSEVLWRHS